MYGMILGKKSSRTTNNWSFADLVRELPVPEKHAGQLRARQLEMVGKMSVVLVLANLLNGAIVMMSFNDSAAGNMLAIWGFALVFASGVAFLAHVRSRKMYGRTHRSERALERYARGASINGLIWAVAPIIVMNIEDSHGQMVMGIVLSGVMFGGAFLLSRIPDAAFSFIVPVAIGMVIAMQFQQDPAYHFISILALVYLGVLMLAVRWAHRQFVEQHLSEAAVQEQSQLIGLLLRDFEESTSDWLWQTDKAGVLEDIPLVMQGDKNQFDMMAQGVELSELFEAGEAQKALEASLNRRQGFRDIVLKISAGDEERWWSVTGKPIFEEDLFTGFRGVASDVTQSKEIEDRVAHMAHYDGLTGLPNRMTMQEKLEKSTREPVEAGFERALLWLDLDNFKWVNDTLGHPAGDELLQLVAKRLNDACFSTDMIARLSGDEFVLIVEREQDLLEPFLDELSEIMSQPYDVWGSTVVCSASIGVRQFDMFATDARVLLKHADLALYQAKKLGKSNWCRFTADLDEKARAKLQIEADLNRALDNNELRVFFQPLVDATSHKMVGVETLIRWQHPKRGLVFPGEFIEHAETNGLITRMGDWVIRAALSEARKLPDDVKISVNISPLQIHSASLVTTIVNALATNQIDPNRVELEITESVLMSDTDFTLKRLHQLKELGLRIALDDFGTGFSSLSYLRSFPFDKIKIDKCFVSDIESRADSKAITIATLNLASSLGMRCTAEGVETGYQADFLRDNGCDELQGYFISKAQPLEKLAHLVELKSVPETVVSSVEPMGERVVDTPQIATDQQSKVS
jgi:diguanylate cyclase (GGDEF)-like protein